MGSEGLPVSKPKTRNAALTRERILEMATREFADRGYDGASIEAIVLCCEISKNLIYHYFESKEGLFIAVMERAYGAMRERQTSLQLTGEPVSDMRALVTKTVQHFIDHPDFHRLLSTENLHKASHIRKSSVISPMFNPLREALSEILQQGKDKGLFRKDADWVNLYVSISGLGSYALTNKYTLSYVLDVDLDELERKASRVEHAADVILGYLCDLSRSQ